mgnify:CR=1 FL=1
MRNFMDLSRVLKSLADAFHTIKLKLDGLYDSIGAVGNQFELIETVTTEEDVSTIEINFSAPVSEFIVFIKTEVSADTGTMRIRLIDGETTLHSNVINSAITTSAKYISCRYFEYKGIKTYWLNAAVSTTYTNSQVLASNTFETNTIDKLEFTAATSGVLIPQGSTIEIYGIYA